MAVTDADPFARRRWEAGCVVSPDGVTGPSTEAWCRPRPSACDAAGLLVAAVCADLPALSPTT